MDRLPRDEWLLDIVDVVARRGTCAKWQVGALAARNGRVLVTGYNGAPAGMRHCDHTCLCGSDAWKGIHSEECPASGPCLVSVHAEANVIAYAARYGVRLAGATLYSTLSVCLTCAQLVVNAGIVRGVARDWYRNVEGLELCEKSGLEMLILNPQEIGYKG